MGARQQRRNRAQPAGRSNAAQDRASHPWRLLSAGYSRRRPLQGSACVGVAERLGRLRPRAQARRGPISPACCRRASSAGNGVPDRNKAPADAVIPLRGGAPSNGPPGRLRFLRPENPAIPAAADLTYSNVRYKIPSQPQVIMNRTIGNPRLWERWKGAEQLALMATFEDSADHKTVGKGK